MVKPSILIIQIYTAGVRKVRNNGGNMEVNEVSGREDLTFEGV